MIFFVVLHKDAGGKKLTFLFCYGNKETKNKILSGLYCKVKSKSYLKYTAESVQGLNKPATL